MISSLILLAQTESRGSRAPEPLGHLADLVVNWSTIAFELLGVLVIVLGTLWAGVLLVRRWSRREPQEHSYQHLRANLGRAILLGLELLVAADIINTVAVDPTLRSVAVLGLIVLIRTFLSFSLEVEISGKWPWQQEKHGGT